jgi:hypothetical protein
MSNNWIDRFKPKAKANKSGKNPLAALFGGQSSFDGVGKSLGGSLPGIVIPVELSQPGSLGLKIEKRPDSRGTAIISMVVPDSQAERAGLERGDILCFAGSNGEEEIMYDMFLDLAQSNQRPICFDVRRISTKTDNGGRESAGSGSADAFIRKQAMIAAAEAREKALKMKQKPVKRGISIDERARQEELLRQNDAALPDNTPKSEASWQALEAVKKVEAQTAVELGYNPYETNRVTAGQARNVVIASTAGPMSNASSVTDHSTSGLRTIPVRPPADALEPAVTNIARIQFDEAYERLVTLNDHSTVLKSMGILRKLILNAITKGQQANDTDAHKFRRVRLTNEKIKAAIVDVEGALDLMLSTGFHVQEEQTETVLVYPVGVNGPDWLPMALNQMETYEKS